MKIYGLARLTRDAELRYSQGSSSTAFATFGIAVERRFKGENEPDADFFDCVAFNAKAEFIGNYLGKGSKVFIEGDLRNDNYTNKEGQKVYRNRIYVSDIEFADSKKDASPAPAEAPAVQNPAASSRKAQPAGARQKAAAGQAAQEGFMSIPDGIGDELPFLN